MTEEKDEGKERNDFIAGEELIRRLPKKEVREFSFLLLGIVFGAALGILGNLWVAFLLELLRSFIPQESWVAVSFLGLAITSILSVYVLIKTIGVANKYIMREEKDKAEKRRVQGLV